MPNTRLYLEHFRAWVVVDKKELECHGIMVDRKTKMSTCWIASEVGKEFKVHVQKTRITKHHCVARLVLDGHKADGCVLHPGSQNNSGVLDSFLVSGSIERPFVFSQLEVTDDDAYLDASSSLQNIGEIKITFHRVIRQGKLSFLPMNEVPNVSKIHERSKKAMISHQVSYGEERKLDSNTPMVFDTEYDHLPLATFVFRYRPLDMLKAQQIIPCDPSLPLEDPRPTPNQAGPSKRKLSQVKKENREKDSDDDIDDREAALLAELEKIRNEKQIRKKIKTEPPFSFTPGEIIDLT